MKVLYGEDELDLVKEGKKNWTFFFDCQKPHDQHMGNRV